jgi:hypothetical protein
VIEMKCEDIRKLLFEYHDESLHPGQREEVEKHLAGCEGCRAKLEEIRQTLGLLAQDKVPEREESFWVDFLPQVRSRIEQKQKTRWLAWPKIRWAVGLVSVLALATVGSLVLTRESVDVVQQEAEQPVETTLALYDPYSYADQLADVISSDSTESYPPELLLANGSVEDLGLAQKVLEEDYVREADVDLILSELSLEELKLLEENVKSLQAKDIL